MEPQRCASVEEWQLLSFFEVEPERLDPSVPWIYDDSVYSVERDPFSISFAIEPFHRDVRLILSCKGARVYELNLTGARDVRYVDDGGQEQLHVDVADREVLRLRLRPTVEIQHDIKRA